MAANADHVGQACESKSKSPDSRAEQKAQDLPAARHFRLVLDIFDLGAEEKAVLCFENNPRWWVATACSLVLWPGCAPNGRKTRRPSCSLMHSIVATTHTARGLLDERRIVVVYDCCFSGVRGVGREAEEAPAAASSSAIACLHRARLSSRLYHCFRSQKACPRVAALATVLSALPETPVAAWRCDTAMHLYAAPHKWPRRTYITAACATGH